MIVPQAIRDRVAIPKTTGHNLGQRLREPDGHHSCRSPGGIGASPLIGHGTASILPSNLVLGRTTERRRTSMPCRRCSGSQRCMAVQSTGLSDRQHRHMGRRRTLLGRRMLPATPCRGAHIRDYGRPNQTHQNSDGRHPRSERKSTGEGANDDTSAPGRSVCVGKPTSKPRTP